MAIRKITIIYLINNIIMDDVYIYFHVNCNFYESIINICTSLLKLLIFLLI
jgi:hypothetical protein